MANRPRSGFGSLLHAALRKIVRSVLLPLSCSQWTVSCPYIPAVPRGVARKACFVSEAIFASVDGRTDGRTACRPDGDGLTPAVSTPLTR